MNILSGPAQEVIEATKAVISAATKIPDALDRSVALHLAGSNVPHLASEIRVARAAAIREAIAQRDATSVAAELGISRARLYQILGE